MKRNLYACLFAIGCVLSACSPKEPVPAGQVPGQTLRRSDSFFGLHFDFHASETDSFIGKTFTPEMADSLLALVKPDYIQVDCKGHPGISSYPTKVGNPAPGFVNDPMKIWREVTRKHGVALFVHYSGVWDGASALKHPDWTAIDAKGRRSDSRMAVKGPYVDSLLIPQFKELISNYDIDGCWVDGECWALGPDYSKKITDGFRAETGLTTIPKSFAEPGGYEFYEYNRKAFREYLAHYIDELHRYDPEFQITSNWAFSSLMPEPVDVSVDFISGDFSHVNSVYSGLYESRCMAPQGKPWDLMSWSFAYDFKTGAMVTKSAAQLKQLAATVLSMGGGYQVYFQQNRDASPRPWQFGLMKEVAEFCRERQAWCHKAVPVPQIALLYSTADYKKNSGRLYQSSGFNDPLKGMLNILLNGQNAVEILMEHHLKGRMGDYPLIVIPESRYLDEEFKNELKAYVREGGNLLVTGTDATAMFREELGIELKDTVFAAVQSIASGTQMAALSSVFQAIVPGPEAEVCGNRYDVPDFRFGSKPAATVTSYGKGKIAGVYFNIGKNYLSWANPVYRDFIGSIVRQLFPQPVVSVSGSENVAVTVNRLNDQLTVNLINLAGEHANEKVARYDEIPAAGPLTLTIRADKRPSNVSLQPENEKLNFRWKDNLLEVTVPKLEIHAVLVIE